MVHPAQNCAGYLYCCVQKSCEKYIKIYSIPLKYIKNHQIAYLEGYLWDNEKAKQAMKKMVDICKADQQKIAFTLSDLFCVDRHRNSFKELIDKDVDILFGNQDEFSSMVNSKNINDGVEYAKSLKILSIITLAEKGSLIVSGDRILEIKAEISGNSCYDIYQ